MCSLNGFCSWGGGAQQGVGGEHNPSQQWLKQNAAELGQAAAPNLSVIFNNRSFQSIGGDAQQPNPEKKFNQRMGLMEEQGGFFATSQPPFPGCPIHLPPTTVAQGCAQCRCHYRLGGGGQDSRGQQ